MKRHILSALCALILSLTAGSNSVFAQQGPSTYADGDSLARLVKMNYVYTLEDALRLSREKKKPIFFNAFADFARPCHGMNGMVFSNEEFCNWMDKNFICLFVDVAKRENRHLAERYGISAFAHYLVLNQQGEVVHRIIGGAPLPAFQEKVAAALSPRTSLQGTTEAYAKGDHSKKTLLAYVTALNDAGEDSLYKAVLPEYEKLLTQADFPKKENWFIVKRKLNAGSQSDMFRFVVENRAKFDKTVGAEEVNTVLSQVYASDIFNRMSSGEPYNAAAMTDTYLAMQNAGLPDSLVCYNLYNIAKSYGTKDYQKLLTQLPQLKDIQLRTIVELSLKYDELEPDDRAAVIAYYREREQAYREVRSSYARGYQEIADGLEKPATTSEGVIFAQGSFNEVLAQAKAESKMVFVDCYTSWCGPCKMLAKQTFPDPSVGEFFNPRFVSIQIDMEKGEGIELAKKWGVDAYPTMLILDANGEVKGRIVGFLKPQQLVEEVKKVLGQ